jgi:hypothetical protein
MGQEFIQPVRAGKRFTADHGYGYSAAGCCFQVLEKPGVLEGLPQHMEMGGGCKPAGLKAIDKFMKPFGLEVKGASF